MSNFQTTQDYWTFWNTVTRIERFIFSDKTRSFLSAVVESLNERACSIPVDRKFFRAQAGIKDIVEDQEITERAIPYDKRRMVPLRDQAQEGRANPTGIPVLYGATNKETAMAEVRPWLGSLISVCTLRVLRPLIVINCTEKGLDTPNWLIERPSQDDIDKSVWADLDKAFSRPIERNDLMGSYAPTQIIAELFRNESYDGLAYRSSMGKGHNLAIFDIDAVEVEDVWVEEVRDVKYTFDIYP